MNTPVSSELVKLLDTKGWKFPYTIEHLEEIQGSYKYYDSIPTIADVVMWLYEKHRIWISVGVVPFEKYYMFEYAISKLDGHIHQDGVFDIPTEAYEAAIEYTLNNLI